MIKLTKNRLKQITNALVCTCPQESLSRNKDLGLRCLDYLHFLGYQWLSMLINGLKSLVLMVLSFLNHLHLLGDQWPVCKGGNTDWPGLQIILMRELFTKNRCWRENGDEPRIICKRLLLARQ